MGKNVEFQIMIDGDNYNPRSLTTAIRDSENVTQDEINNRNKLEITTIKENAENLKNKVDKSKSNLELIQVNLNDYASLVKGDDWTPVFKHVFENVIKNNCGIVTWGGAISIGSSIIVPEGVSLHGGSLPHTQLIVKSTFVGDFAIIDNNLLSHNSFKNFYIDFSYNSNVGGIKYLNPYDYSSIEKVIGNNCNKNFFNVGGSDISQGLRISDCLVYGKNGLTTPLVELNNVQEFYIENNKFMCSGTANCDLFVTDGMTTSTIIHNSFANTNNVGMVNKCVKYPKRLVGNNITSNLFENILGAYAFTLDSNNSSNFEGYNNSIMNNDYMGGTSKVNIGNMANCIIIDKCNVSYGAGARRIFNINPYKDGVVTDANGHCELYPDGEWLRGKFKGKVNIAEGEFLYTKKNGTVYFIDINDGGELTVRQA